MRSGLRALLSAGTGSFSVTISLAGAGVSIEESGDYRLDTRAHQATREVASDQGSVMSSYLGVGDRRWLRLESLSTGTDRSGPWPCWVDVADLAGVEGAPPDLAQMSGGPPAALVAASYALGERVLDASTIIGTMDLGLTLGLVNRELVTASEVDPEGDDTVPATFGLEDGVLSGFSVALADLPRAIDRAGGRVSPEISTLAALPDSIDVTFSDPGEPVQISAPDEIEIADVAGAGDLEQALAGCAAR